MKKAVFVYFRVGSGEALQRALVELGVAWQPQSEQELLAVDEILRQPEA